MKPSLRTLALAVIVSLSLACNAVTQPFGLGRATPEIVLPEIATPDIELPALATPDIEVPDVEAMATELAATLEAELGTLTEIAPEPTAKPEAKPTAKPTAPAKPTAAPAGKPDPEAAIRVANSLSVLLGDTPGTELLPSYHLEVRQLSPVMAGNEVTQAEQQISADVEGGNVHFTITTTKPGGKPVVTEAYIIGDQNYSVKDGQVQEDYGLSSVAWSTWPINAYFALGMGVLQTVPAGTEELEGRTADKYTLGGTSADDPTGALSAAGLPVTNVTGEVWLDQETGALLKAMLDYQALITESDGTTGKKAGDGRLEITVTQVGKVTVEDPTK